MEDIIKCVKKHPILYENCKTPNSGKKRKASWEEIALDLGLSVEAVKKKWAYLRESYHKSLRDGKSKKWQWAEEMEFLRPHLRYPKDFKNTTTDQELLNGTNEDAEVDERVPRHKERRISTYVSRPGTPTSDEDYAESIYRATQTPKIKLPKSKRKEHKHEHKFRKTEEHEHKFRQTEDHEHKFRQTEEHEHEPPAQKREISNEVNMKGPTPKKIRAMNSAVESDSSITTTITPWNPSFDAIELLFLGYAKTLKEFAPKNQAVAKMKIAKIIMEQELLQCDQDERRDSFLGEF